jgi:hypothetical protein
MKTFLNLKNGIITMSNSKLCDAEVCSRDELIEAYVNASEETLSAIAEEGDEHYADNEPMNF